MQHGKTCVVFNILVKRVSKQTILSPHLVQKLVLVVLVVKKLTISTGELLTTLTEKFQFLLPVLLAHHLLFPRRLVHCNFHLDDTNTRDFEEYLLSQVVSKYCIDDERVLTGFFSSFLCMYFVVA